MKIGLITRGFTGSILPLAKQMLKDGHLVDIFIICNSDILDDIEAFECDYHAKQYGLQQIPQMHWISGKKYMESDLIRLFCIRYYRPYESVPVIRNTIKLINDFYTKKSISYINEQEYDMINIVAGYYSKEYIPFIEGLKKKPIISLHEVCNHFSPDFSSPSIFLKALFEHNLPIIVYSDNSYKDIIKYKDVKTTSLHRINFGLFTSYRSVNNDSKLKLPDEYILFYGTLKAYKGLNVLYDAITQNDALLNNIKCVVAGAGTDDSFDKMKLDKRFVCIQKRLTNGELISLIQGAKFVVCPYLTVSQSGIPQTVFVFNKPIIASRLEGLTEILNDSNSILFDTGNSCELANCIRNLLKDSQRYNSIVEQITNIEKNSSPYSWEYIAHQYYHLISNI